MIVPDANLLLYAYDSNSPFHQAASSWWTACMSGSEPVGLCHAVLFAFVRISTSARVYERPLPLTDAVRHVESWMSRRVTRLLLPDERHHATVLELLREAGSAGGNLVTDAQIAALARQLGATVHTADQDFRRFPDVAVSFPLDGEPA